jgi:hypothetical protein
MRGSRGRWSAGAQCQSCIYSREVMMPSTRRMELSDCRHLTRSRKGGLSRPVLRDFDALPQGALLNALPSPFQILAGLHHQYVRI